jgi:hypothetical protein
MSPPEKRTPGGNRASAEEGSKRETASVGVHHSRGNGRIGGAQ